MCEFKQKTMITGANGFIGRHLVQNMSSKCKLIAAVRKDSSALNSCIDKAQVDVVTVGNLTVDTDWSMALKGVDTVIHLAGRAHKTKENPLESIELFRTVNCKASLSLLKQASHHGVSRFIYLSSIGVIGNNSGLIPLSEASDCKPKAAYAKSKLEAENALISLAKDLEIELVIIRPPLVYGGGAPGNFGTLIKLVNRWPVLPFGLVRNQKSFISIENLVSFIETCISHPNAANELFVVSDDETISTKILIDLVAFSLQKKVFQLPIPPQWLRFILKLIGKESLASQLLDDLVIDTAKAKHLLSWEPQRSTESSLKNLY